MAAVKTAAGCRHSLFELLLVCAGIRLELVAVFMITSGREGGR